jgi:ubiquinone/menaquinone biosynthesis C-methylase UbiE
MTWEETIIFIRKEPKYKFLVEAAYFEENLPLNVERFEKSEEWKEILAVLQQTQKSYQRVLDIGAGNGITSVAFARLGCEVSSVEPDPSLTIGAGAIRKLKEYYHLANLSVFEAFAEEIQFPDAHFDLVFARQCMHHAYDLEKFVAEASRVLKPGGLFMTVRDHVVFDEKDKAWFLEMHPLHKFYGGENAFSPDEYKRAFKKAGLKILSELKHYESVINYFPLQKSDIENHTRNLMQKRKEALRKKSAFLAQIPVFFSLYSLYLDLKVGKIKPLNERDVPGRMYSYICVKA